ncbi:MAG: hypothetical protein OXE99_11875 [Cellvibrionales bacterium]|nr:hypothetical protein [Cellvibrionales bacterium]
MISLIFFFLSASCLSIPAFYSWVVDTKNNPSIYTEDNWPIFNNINFPFLQNAIGQSDNDHSTRLCYLNLFSGEKEKEVDDSFKALQKKMLENNLNISVIRMNEIINEDIRFFKPLSLTNQIDLLKCYIGKSLKAFDIPKQQTAAITDFDSLPFDKSSTTNVDLTPYSVIPYIDPSLTYKKGIISFNHPVENPIIWVQGEHNTVMASIVAHAFKKTPKYWKKHPHDGVYSLFVKEILRHHENKNVPLPKKKQSEIKKLLEVPSEQLFKENRERLPKLMIFRGDSWQAANLKVTTQIKNIPITFKTGIFGLDCRIINLLIDTLLEGTNLTQHRFDHFPDITLSDHCSESKFGEMDIGSFGIHDKTASNILVYHELAKIKDKNFTTSAQLKKRFIKLFNLKFNAIEKSSLYNELMKCLDTDTNNTLTHQLKLLFGHEN